MSRVICRSFVLLSAFFVLFSNAVFAQMGQVDTKHISENSFAVVRIDFKQILKQVKKDSEDVANTAKMLNDELGIDLRTLETITFQLGPPPPSDDDLAFSATFEFNKPVKQSTLLDRMGNQHEDAEHNGKKYKNPRSEHDPAIYFESDKKFTLASPNVIADIIDAAQGMGSNSSRIKSISPGSEIAIVLTKPEGFDKIQDNILDSFGLPPIANNELIEKFSNGALYINFRSGVPFHLQGTFVDEKVAKKAQTGLQGLIGLGATYLPSVKKYVKEKIAELKDEKDGFDAYKRNVMEKTFRAIEAGEVLLSEAKVTVDGKSLDMKCKRMGGIRDGGEILFFGLQVLVLGGSNSAVAPPPVGPIDEAAPIPDVPKKQLTWNRK